MDTILVTGCAGFIGSHVCELLLAKGFKVIGIDNFDPFYNRTLKEQNLNNFLHHAAFDFYEYDICTDLDRVPEADIKAVIHLAAKAGVRPSLQNPTSYIHTNIVGTQQIQDFMLKRGITKLVFASSSSVYGNNKKVPFAESDVVDYPISPYAFTKKAGELMNYTFHHLHQVDIINLRFFTVYGPRQRPDLAINKFIQLIKYNKTLTLFGDGSTARDYTYIDDTVKGIYAALQYCMQESNVYAIVNLGNKTPVTLNELVDEIYRVLNKQKNVLFEEMQPGDVDITFADITVAKNLLNYTPTVSIEEGLSKYVSWLDDNQNR
ncbi:MAG: GDP-mannose 4,6-dehydratase [Ferruginibacter sp.]